jgi:hypothetical protein
VVHPSDPRFPRDEVEAARYYLGPRFDVVSGSEGPESGAAKPATIYDAYCLSSSANAAPGTSGQAFDGLVLKRRLETAVERQRK